MYLLQRTTPACRALKKTATTSVRAVKRTAWSAWSFALVLLIWLVGSTAGMAEDPYGDLEPEYGVPSPFGCLGGKLEQPGDWTRLSR